MRIIIDNNNNTRYNSKNRLEQQLQGGRVPPGATVQFDVPPKYIKGIITGRAIMIIDENR